MHRICLTMTLTLALVLTTAPVAAHDTTPFRSFQEGVVGTFRAISEIDFTGASPAASAQALDELVPDLRDFLLSTVPDQCYEDQYAALWVLYADFLHLRSLYADFSVDPEFVARLDDTVAFFLPLVVSDAQTAGEAVETATCPG